MTRVIQSAFIAFALLAVPAGTSIPASAAVDLSVSLGNVAFGYSDGYWDRDHMWHSWRNKDEARYYREHYGEHYVNARHDKNRDQGWRNERWWEEGRDQDRDRDRH